jgi:hypothetical protein
MSNPLYAPAALFSGVRVLLKTTVRWIYNDDGGGDDRLLLVNGLVSHLNDTLDVYGPTSHTKHQCQDDVL